MKKMKLYSQMFFNKNLQKWFSSMFLFNMESHKPGVYGTSTVLKALSGQTLTSLGTTHRGFLF